MKNLKISKIFNVYYVKELLLIQYLVNNANNSIANSVHKNN
jgi:hypothetical protein